MVSDKYLCEKIFSIHIEIHLKTRMILSKNKRAKIAGRRLKRIKFFLLCKLLFAGLPTVVFGVFTVVFTLEQNASARATREQDQRQEDENNRRIIFKEYIDDMTELLLERIKDTNISEILLHIRVQTLTVLRSIDEKQKVSVMVFLYENGLLRGDSPFRVDLRGANFTGIQLWGSSNVACELPFLYLPGIYAEKINFYHCSLPGAVFDNASMSLAKFVSCSLWNAQFVRSNLTGAQFEGNHLSTSNFSGAYLSQSSIKSGFFRTVNLANTDLYQSDIADEMLFPTINLGLSSHTFLNTRFPNGSFVYLENKNLFFRDQSAFPVSLIRSSPNIDIFCLFV